MKKIKKASQGGFQTLFTSANWKIACNTYQPGLNDAASFSSMGRHRSTEEAFMLLRGAAVLLTAGNDKMVRALSGGRLKPGEVYVVEKDEWHVVVFQEDSTVWVVENAVSAPADNPTQELTGTLLSEARALACDLLQVESK